MVDSNTVKNDKEGEPIVERDDLRKVGVVCRIIFVEVDDDDSSASVFIGRRAAAATTVI